MSQHEVDAITAEQKNASENIAHVWVEDNGAPFGVWLNWKTPRKSYSICTPVFRSEAERLATSRADLLRTEGFTVLEEKWVR